MRCKCGKAECGTSMGTHPCQGCEKCGTTYATHPADHQPLEPHQWVTKYHQSTGKPYKACGRCWHTDPDSFKEAGS